MEPESSAKASQRREGSVEPALLRTEVQLGIRFVALFTIAVLAIFGWNQTDSNPVKGNALRINVNQASLQELTLLPGIGETMAKRILADRRTKGRYHSVQELVRVHGIGERTVMEILPYCTVNRSSGDGAEWVVVAKPATD